MRVSESLDFAKTATVSAATVPLRASIPAQGTESGTLPYNLASSSRRPLISISPRTRSGCALKSLFGKHDTMCQSQISKSYRRRAVELRLAASTPRSSRNRDTLLYFADDLD